jgi:Fic family protein
MGYLAALPEQGIDLHLRRINRITTITGSLAIEGNNITEEQIIAILNGKLIFKGPPVISSIDCHVVEKYTALSLETLLSRD